MPIPTRPTHPSPDPRYRVLVTDDGSRTLIAPSTGVTFHSGCGAASETRVVYLENSGVADRLAAGRPTRVLELGVGLGWNLLLTADAAAAHAAPLTYVGYEQSPLSVDTLRSIHIHDHLNTPALADDFHHHWPALTTNGQTHYTSGGIDIQLCNDDFTRTPATSAEPFDAIYFDPFDPATNPECWTPSVFTHLRRVAHANTRLVTYAISRVVKDALRSSGWTITKTPGPAGGKREVLAASPPSQP